MLLLFIIFARKKLYKPFLVILMTQNFGRMDNHSNTCMERGHKIVNFMTLQPATQGGIIVKSVKFMYFLQISSSLTPEQ